MAITLAGSGTQTAVIGTEHVLFTATTVGGVYVFSIDCAALLEGATPDLVELRCYSTTLTGGTEREVYSATYVGAQADPIKYSPPIPADGLASGNCFKATVKQVQGTGRALPWKVLSL